MHTDEADFRLTLCVSAPIYQFRRNNRGSDIYNPANHTKVF